MDKLNELFPILVSLFILFAVTLGISLAVAYISYRIIEEPGIKLGRKITSSKRINTSFNGKSV